MTGRYGWLTPLCREHPEVDFHPSARPGQPPSAAQQAAVAVCSAYLVRGVPRLRP